jgi:RimJ/RimL family protein N-acetyltransferase
VDREEIQAALLADPPWSAYALADLDPAFQEFCTWRVRGGAAVLEYGGLEPPVLFAIGAVDQVETLLANVPPGRYEYMLLDEHFNTLKSRMQVEIKTRMWRMVLDGKKVTGKIPKSCNHLTSSDAAAIEKLISGQPDSPDAYHPSQLNQPGVFYGTYAGDELVALAGTHIVSPSMSVAAVGNIFVHPDRRGGGLCQPVTQAVVSHLIREGIKLIVLNVSMANQPAIRCYEKVGFIPHCQYLEGIGRLAPVDQVILEP